MLGSLADLLASGGDVVEAVLGVVIDLAKIGFGSLGDMIAD